MTKDEAIEKLRAEIKHLELGAHNVAGNARIRGDSYDLGYAQAMERRCKEVLAATATIDADHAPTDAGIPISDEPSLAEVIAFLNGEGPIYGYWFGERPAAERGAFWWRKHLMTAWQARGQQQAGVADGCRHRIADARNPHVESGYVCIDCGALFAAADHSHKARSSAPGEA